ncbi:MAG TPA: RNA polymerase sporulation sigma factor SigH [Lachnospiraceae bacterium]|nr:RNA polymerase sporulation sigma factor SigH [Lachnospiraceae bacterium]
MGCIKLLQADFNSYKDEEIIDLVKKGNDRAQEFIMNKYKTMVKSRARAYFLIGADREDIIQEGMIGLYKAVRDYQTDKNASFKSFAELCINRQMITAIKTAGRQKHIPLNSSVSLNRPVFDDLEEHTYMDMLESIEVTSPETLFIGQEEKSFIEEHIAKNLSGFENKVLAFYLQGKTYLEIAALMNKPEKSIDNALQRVKKKIERFINKRKLDD